MTQAASLSSSFERSIFEAVRLAYKNPLWFRSAVLRQANDPWQDEMLQAFLDVMRFQRNEPTVVNHEGLNRFSITSGHGPGKTNVIAQLMHLCGFVRRSQIICTATKYKQVTTRLWPTFRTILTHSIDEYRVLIKMKQQRIVWAGDQDWYAMPETATAPENLQGLHPLGPDNFLMFNIDEASGIKQSLFPAIQGALSKPNTALFMIGNPTQNEGEFYESHNKPGVMRYYYRRHVRPEESTHMDAKWVAQMRERYGENSPIYKVRVLGEFAEDAANQLVAMGWVMRALEAEFATDGSLPRKRVSVDVADGGVDECVLHAAELYETRTLVRKLLRRSYPQSEAPILVADEAERLFAAIGGRKEEDEFVVDGIGVGAGTAGVLLGRGYRVIVHKGGESSGNAALWRNRRVQCFMCLRDDYRDQRIFFAEDCFENDFDRDDMIAQLRWVKTKPGLERVEDLQTKDELIRESGKSPDIADSQAMLYAAQVPRTGSVAIQFSQTGDGLVTAESEAANAYW